MDEAHNISIVEKKLKVNFKNKELLQRALTHRSYINENKNYTLGHNERLEFLGDAVLELLITEKLFHTYPNQPEGILTSIRAALVRTETLAEKSRKLNYGAHLLMSKGEEITGGRDREYILANTFEAVLGAMYLDQGLAVCKSFLETVLFPMISNIIKEEKYIDNKSKLQEVAQEKLKFTPYYEVIEETGPDHDKTFTMVTMIGKKQYGKGKGKNKQIAEQMAAKRTLEILLKNSDYKKIAIE